MIRLWERLCCAIGMHAWWYVPSADQGRLSAIVNARIVRICSTCPAKQKLVTERGRQQWVIS